MLKQKSIETVLVIN